MAEADDRPTGDVASPMLQRMLLAAFIVGTAFMLLLLLSVLLVPEPTHAQMLVFRILLALCGAAYSTPLTGLLAVRLNLPRQGFIAAGGALGVFVILFFFAPNVGEYIVGNHNTVIHNNSGKVHVQ